MSSKKTQHKLVSRGATPRPSAGGQPPTVSARWLLTAVALTLAAAVVCAWVSLCLLFWQGSWQLLYHPKSAVTRTPANMGVNFDALGFAVNETGQMRLAGWYIPAAANARYARFTVVYLHGQSGNLSDTVPALAVLHNAGVNVFAFDYRGYGQSQFAHPSEARWRQDAEWALNYLTGTRHVDPRTIVIEGDALGADLAVEVAAQHPELSGVIAQAPLNNAAGAIFNDPRARLVPAHLLVRDRWNLSAAAASLRIPSLWLLAGNSGAEPQAIEKVPARKTVVWTGTSAAEEKNSEDALARWLDELAGTDVLAAPVHSPS